MNTRTAADYRRLAAVARRQAMITSQAETQNMLRSIATDYEGEAARIEHSSGSPDDPDDAEHRRG